MPLVDLRVADLLAAFRSPDPTPGGGSASALSGAVGASLLAMVAALPKPRAQGLADENRLQAARARCVTISDRFAALMDRDREAYDSVVAAFRLPKGTEDEKGIRTGRIQQALQAATETPLDVMRGCLEALHVSADVARLGNANAASDVEVALELLTAGLRGAKANVAINLSSIKDQAYVENATKEAGGLEVEADRATRTARAALANSSG